MVVVDVIKILDGEFAVSIEKKGITREGLQLTVSALEVMYRNIEHDIPFCDGTSFIIDQLREVGVTVEGLLEGVE